MSDRPVLVLLFKKKQQKKIDSNTNVGGRAEGKEPRTLETFKQMWAKRRDISRGRGSVARGSPRTRSAPPELGAFTSNRLLTKPLIHPETGGQVSAGGARDEENRRNLYFHAKLLFKKKPFPKRLWLIPPLLMRLIHV